MLVATLEKARQVMSALQSRLLGWWLSFVKRTSQLRRRPWLVNLGSLLRSIPFTPLDVNCLYFLEYLGLPPQNPNLLRGPGAVRDATVQDLEGLTKCQDRPLAFLNRFKADDHCVVAVADGQIVAYQWFCAKPFYVEERYAYRIDVPPDTIYEYDVFILPAYRLGGLWFKFHCLYLKELMQRLQRRRIIGMVDYGNRISMSTHLRFGFRVFRRVAVVKLFGKSFFIEKTFRADEFEAPGWMGGARGPRARGPERPEPSSTSSAAKRPAVGSVHGCDAPKSSTHASEA